LAKFKLTSFEAPGQDRRRSESKKRDDSKACKQTMQKCYNKLLYAGEKDNPQAGKKSNGW
jgi:hypothetical protein